MVSPEGRAAGITGEDFFKPGIRRSIERWGSDEMKDWHGSDNAARVGGASRFGKVPTLSEYRRTVRGEEQDAYHRHADAPAQAEPEHHDLNEGAAPWKPRQRVAGANGGLPEGYSMHVEENPKTERWGLPAVHVRIKHTVHGLNGSRSKEVGGLSVHQRSFDGGATVVGHPNVSVHPDHRRKGLATAMYAEVHRRWPDVPIVHSPDRSDDARALDQTLKDKFGPDRHQGSASRQRVAGATLMTFAEFLRSTVASVDDDRVHYVLLDHTDPEGAAAAIRSYASSPEQHTAATRQPESTEWSRAVMHETVKKHGFSFHDHVGDGPKNGYMVSTNKASEHTVPAMDFQAHHVADYRDLHQQDLVEPSHYVGGWVHKGRVFLDVSKHVPDRSEAMSLARQHRQLAIFNVAKGEEEDTEPEPAEQGQPKVVKMAGAKDPYCHDEEARWTGGDCGTYAHALTEMNPDLRVGTVNGGIHFFAHNETHAWDANGQHRLHHFGLQSDHGQHQGDHLSLGVDPGVYEEPRGSEHDVADAKDHARRNGILEGKHAWPGSKPVGHPDEVHMAPAEEFSGRFAASKYAQSGKGWDWDSVEEHPDFGSSSAEFLKDVARNGIRNPVVVDPDRQEVTSGHHRVMAALHAEQSVPWVYRRSGKMASLLPPTYAAFLRLAGRSEDIDDLGRSEHPNVTPYISGGIGHRDGDESRSVVGFLPTKLVRTYREHAGDWNDERSRQKVESIRADLRAGKGITNPVQMMYDHQAGWGYVGEGNHRVEAAHQEGMKTVPVRVYGRSRNDLQQKEGIGGPMHLNTDFTSQGGNADYVPPDIHPHHFTYPGGRTHSYDYAGDPRWQGHGKTAGAKGDLPDLHYQAHPPSGAIVNHTLEAWKPEHVGDWQGAHPADRNIYAGSSFDPGHRPVGSVSWHPQTGEIMGIYTDPEHKRRGVASELLRRARQIDPKVHHSENLTDSGRAWSDKVASLPGTYVEFTRLAAHTGNIEVAGALVKAADTGRVLLLQRSVLDDKDPAKGLWEAPGGHLDEGEDPLAGAQREWSEETGAKWPKKAVLVGNWVSKRIYQGFLFVVPKESDLDINLDGEDREVINPDDVRSKDAETLAWWDPAHIKRNPAMRPEFRSGTDLDLVEQATMPKTQGGRTAGVLTDWRPQERLFAPTQEGVDPILFDEQRRMRPQVRHEILTDVADCLQRHGLGDGDGWTRVYLAGSQASLWFGNRDFDLLVGVDYVNARETVQDFRGMSDQQVADALNVVFRDDFNDEQWHPMFDPDTEWHRTGYVNLHGWDIRQIKPYAAYDATRDLWAVEPVSEPTGHHFNETEFYYFEGVAAQVRSALALHEPQRTQRCSQIWSFIHTDRSRSFGQDGTGLFDRGNSLEKYLSQAPYGDTTLMDALAAVRYGKTASGLSDEGRISVAEQMMESHGHGGKTWHVPRMHVDDPAREEAERPVNDYVHHVLTSHGWNPEATLHGTDTTVQRRVRVQPAHWDLRQPGSGQANTDGANYIGLKGEHTNDLTLLHECAHVLTGTSEGQGHGPAFRETAQRLYHDHLSPEAGAMFEEYSQHPSKRKEAAAGALTWEHIVGQQGPDMYPQPHQIEDYVQRRTGHHPRDLHWSREPYDVKDAYPDPEGMRSPSRIEEAARGYREHPQLMPPIIGLDVGGKREHVDGWHRLGGAEQEGMDTVPAFMGRVPAERKQAGLIPSDLERAEQVIRFHQLKGPSDGPGQFTFPQDSTGRADLADFVYDQSDEHAARAALDAPAKHRVTWQHRNPGKTAAAAEHPDHPIDYKTTYEDGEGVVTARCQHCHPQGEPTGVLRWDITSDQPSVIDMSVDEAHRRQGIGTKMFNTARKHESGLQHSTVLTEDGREFARHTAALLPDTYAEFARL